MISQNNAALLSLLTATIMADRRIFEEEISALISTVKTLHREGVITTPLSEARILTWYELNRDHIKSKLTGASFSSWLYTCLDRLRPVEKKHSVLNAMKTIADADGEVHVSERALIVLTSRHWNIETQYA